MVLRPLWRIFVIVVASDHALSIFSTSVRLIVMSGLPDVGKTAISRELARAIGAIYLRLDSMRGETRIADIEGHRLPSWPDVIERDYRPRVCPRLVIDTASCSIGDKVRAICDAL